MNESKRASDASRRTADGAYDTRAIYEALAAAGGSNPTIVIPPRKTASPSKPREELLQQRDESGRCHKRKDSSKLERRTWIVWPNSDG